MRYCGFYAFGVRPSLRIIATIFCPARFCGRILSGRLHRPSISSLASFYFLKLGEKAKLKWDMAMVVCRIV